MWATQHDGPSLFNFCGTAASALTGLSSITLSTTRCTIAKVYGVETINVAVSGGGGGPYAGTVVAASRFWSSFLCMILKGSTGVLLRFGKCVFAHAM